MKRNTKRNRKMSVSASRTMHLAAVVMMLFVMVILNMLVNSRCEQVMKSIGKKQRVLASLEKDRQRESGKWEQMRDSANLDRVLFKLGMPMKYAKSHQIVHMDSSGVPVLSGPAIAADQRRRKEKSAVVQNVQRARSSSSRTVMKRR